MSAINTSNGLVVLNHTFTHNVDEHAKCVMSVNMLVSDIDISIIHIQIVKSNFEPNVGILLSFILYF